MTEHHSGINEQVPPTNNVSTVFVIIVGVVVLLFVGLIIASILDFKIPNDSRWLVYLLISFVIAIAAWFSIDRIPSKLESQGNFRGQKVTWKIAGGGAACVGVFAALYYIAPPPPPGPPPVPPSSMILQPQNAISFQNEGTSESDDTAFLLKRDDRWAPSTVETVTNDYYNTGTSEHYFDALSARFDFTNGSPADFDTKLRMYIQQGDYHENDWRHFAVLPGDQNPEFDNTPYTKVNNITSINNVGGTWIDVDIPTDYWNGNTIMLTIRIWNARVDVIELVLIPVSK